MGLLKRGERRRYRLGVAAILFTALVLSAAFAALTPTAVADPLPVTLGMTADPAMTTIGASTTLNIHIDVPGASLSLDARAAGEAGFTPLSTLVADEGGNAAFSVAPALTTTYRVEYAGDDAFAPAQAETTVVVSPALTLNVSPLSTLWDTTATLTANLGLPATQLTLSRKAAGEADFTPLGTLTTGADGTAATSLLRCRVTTTYRVEYTGGDAFAPASAEVVAGVRPRLTFAIAQSSVYEGWKVTFSGQATPAHPGARVVLERLTGDGWTAMRTLTLSSASTFKYRWTSVGRGSLSFRITMPADAEHVKGWSARRSVVVKNPNPYGVPTSQPRFIVVDKSQYKLYYHQYGRIVRVFPCVLGKPSTPTPLGRFKIYAMDKNMWGAYGPRRMRYKGLYAIHGTNEPWLLNRFPRAYSHGCTRLANTNIRWLFDRCRVGTPIWNVR